MMIDLIDDLLNDLIWEVSLKLLIELISSLNLVLQWAPKRKAGGVPEGRVAKSEGDRRE